MKLKDKIGVGVMNYLYPYIQEYYKNRGEQMPKKADEREQFTLQEKQLWFLGQEDLLADFYRTRRIVSNVIDTRSEYYYSNANQNIRIVHSGMPSLISYTKARLLTNGGIEYITDNDKATETLKEIADDNKVDTLIKDSAVTESWASKFAWKISNDPDVSDYPILEKYSPQHYKAIYKRGRLQELVFINDYSKNDVKYELHEIYGLGYIDYKLYMITKQGQVEVALTDLEETAELSTVTWNKKVMLAGEKCNVKSDYDGIISEFDALDEAWSQLMDEIRLGRSEVYVPEILHTNHHFDKFRKNYTVMGTDERENGKNQIDHIQPLIRTDEYTKAIRAVTNNILAAVGLSPFTVGIDDFVGANASGDSLTKREMTSLRTRADMIKSWEAFLEEMFGKLLFAYSAFNNKPIKEYEVQVRFGDYISPTREEIITQTKMLVDSSIIDTEKALDDVYGDELEEEEKARILANTGSLTMSNELDNTIE
jgi:hypothetical protein